MTIKSDRVRQYVREGDYKNAMALAKRFRLGITDKERTAMTRAHECMTGNGNFYSQIGYNPEQLISIGIETVCELYGVGGRFDKATENRSLLETQGTVA